MIRQSVSSGRRLVDQASSRTRWAAEYKARPAEEMNYGTREASIFVFQRDIVSKTKGLRLVKVIAVAGTHARVPYYSGEWRHISRQLECVEMGITPQAKALVPARQVRQHYCMSQLAPRQRGARRVD